LEILLLFLERNFFSLATFIILLVIILRGADKIFPKLKKAKVTTPAGGIELERDCGENTEGEERRDCANNRGRRATDVCKMHCDIAGVIETNTKALEDLKKVDKKLIEHDEEQWIDILQIKFCMEEMPKSIRMLAGLKCLWWGLNGDFKAKVLKFKEEYPEVYNDVIACRPELQIGKYAEGRKPESNN
jgi:hypothetical protein